MLTPIIAALSALWTVTTTWLAVFEMKKRFVGGYELDIILVLAFIALVAAGSRLIASWDLKTVRVFVNILHMNRPRSSGRHVSLSSS